MWRRENTTIFSGWVANSYPKFYLNLLKSTKIYRNYVYF